MSKRTPPLPALRAFGALVRLGSIAAAAQELSLTQGAVAHQIRALEAFLDVPLVSRSGRRIALTEEGRIFGYQIRQALDDVLDATERARRRQGRASDAVLRIAVLPSFAQGWLLPRLSAYVRQNPRVQLVFDASMALVDLTDGHVDCAIRFGHGGWSDVVAHPLMGDQLMLLAAPSLLAHRPSKTLADVLQLPVLQASENWSAWLSSLAPSERPAQRPVSHMTFTDSTHLLQAARLGLGVALSRRSIADQLLSEGALVAASAHVCTHTSSYYAVVPQGVPMGDSLSHFLDWLKTSCTQFAKHHLM